MRRLVFIVCLVVFALENPLLVWADGSRSGRVLAEGKGFKITEAELEAYARRFNKPLEGKLRRKLLKSLVTVKLFALEGRSRGVTKEEDDFKAAAEYRKWLIEHYKVPDVAVESYYYSHYKLYEVDGKMLPLDDKLRKEISDRIKSFAVSKIVSAERDRLMKKYEVRFVETSNEKTGSNKSG